MANLAMTHDEIKAALALKYGNAQAVCERIHEKAWHTLTKERDIDGYESLMRSMDCAFHHLEGIQAAAEALGITKDELINAVQIAKAEGRMNGRPKKAVDTFEAVYLDVKAGKLSATAEAKQIGISRSTWYRKAREYEEGEQYIDL